MELVQNSSNILDSLLLLQDFFFIAGEPMRISKTQDECLGSREKEVIICFGKPTKRMNFEWAACIRVNQQFYNSFARHSALLSDQQLSYKFTHIKYKVGGPQSKQWATLLQLIYNQICTGEGKQTTISKNLTSPTLYKVGLFCRGTKEISCLWFSFLHLMIILIMICW